MRIYAKTDIGRVRSSNQDYLREVRINEYTLCIVCDGMGGAAGGSTASSEASSAFASYVESKLLSGEKSENFEEVMRSAVDVANKHVYRMATESRELTGMGTTICALLTDGKTVWAVSVGDSRIYAFSDGKTVRISHDHSYVQALIDSGAITEKEALTHPNKNIITRAVGTGENVECDSYVMDFAVDAFLLCTDGLTNYVSDDELNRVFCQYLNDGEGLVDTLTESANSAGGGDNITVMAIISDK